MPKRCAWADSNPLMAEYHDQEWGLPERDGRVGKLENAIRAAGIAVH